MKVLSWPIILLLAIILIAQAYGQGDQSAVWNVYCNGDNSKCTIAKEPTGELMFKKLGPVDWDTAQAWMNAANSGGTPVNFMPVGKGTSYTYNDIPFEIDGVNLKVDSSQTQDSINLNGKRAKSRR